MWWLQTSIPHQHPGECPTPALLTKFRTEFKAQHSSYVCPDVYRTDLLKLPEKYEGLLTSFKNARNSRCVYRTLLLPAPHTQVKHWVDCRIFAHEIIYGSAKEVSCQRALVTIGDESAGPAVPASRLALVVTMESACSYLFNYFLPFPPNEWHKCDDSRKAPWVPPWAPWRKGDINMWRIENNIKGHSMNAICLYSCSRAGCFQCDSPPAMAPMGRGSPHITRSLS